MDITLWASKSYVYNHPQGKDENLFLIAVANNLRTTSIVDKWFQHDGCRVYCDISTIPEIQERIRRAYIDHQNYPEIIENAKQSFIYRIQNYMEVNGNHFEYFLN